MTSPQPENEAKDLEKCEKISKIKQYILDRCIPAQLTPFFLFDIKN